MYFPVVVQVVPQDNYHVHVYFHDGKVVDFDGSFLSDRFSIEEFKKECNIQNGTLAFGHDCETCLDFDPIVLHEKEAINHLVA